MVYCETYWSRDINIIVVIRFTRAFPDMISEDVLYHEVFFIFQKKSTL